MLMRFMGLGCAALAVVFVAAGARAAGAGGKEDPAGQDRVQDSRKLLEEVLMARLTHELALDEEQTVLMVRRLAEYRETMAALRRERAQLVRALREAVRESNDEAGIEGKLAEIVAQDEKISAARSSFLDVEGLELTAWQRARLYLFVQDFEGDMRRLLKRAQERQQGAHRGPGRPEKAAATEDKSLPAAGDNTTRSGSKAPPAESGATDPGPVQ